MHAHEFISQRYHVFFIHTLMLSGRIRINTYAGTILDFILKSMGKTEQPFCDSLC